MITDTIFSHPVTAAVIAGLLLLGIIGKLMKFSFERIAKWYLYIAVFSVVIVMNSIFFPFIGGKDFFFQVRHRARARVHGALVGVRGK